MTWLVYFSVKLWYHNSLIIPSIFKIQYVNFCVQNLLQLKFAKSVIFPFIMITFTNVTLVNIRVFSPTCLYAYSLHNQKGKKQTNTYGMHRSQTAPYFYFPYPRNQTSWFKILDYIHCLWSYIDYFLLVCPL